MSNENPVIWAKSFTKPNNHKKFINLFEHTADLFRYYKQLEKKLIDLGLEELDKFTLELAIFAHDLGKVSPSFQLSLGNWDYKPRPIFPNIPHSLFSLFWLNVEEINKKLPDQWYKKILFSLIAFHHWRENFNYIIIGKNKDFKEASKLILENEELKENLLNNLRVNLESLQCEEFFEFFEKFKQFIGFNSEFVNAVNNGSELFYYLIPPYLEYFLPYRIEIENEKKRKWIIMAGTLIRVDHFASYIEENYLENETIEKEPTSFEFVKNKILNEFKDPWQLKYIEKNNLRDKNVILIAPTGVGKTEFAFLWSSGNKFIFTLPLRTAVNSIYERSQYYFEDNSSLLHSDADIYIIEKYATAEENEGEILRVIELAQQLSYSTLISTGDQIFPAALKYPGYEKIYAILSYSKLIIDEVQAYNPKSAAIIVKLIEDIVKLGGKFLLMTATLPKFIYDEIKNRISQENYQLIDYYKENTEELEKIKKHCITLVEKDIEDYIKEIIQEAQQNKRVLVILNTISKAQKIYQKIKENLSSDKIYCRLIHSAFTFNDRKSKELELLKEFCNPKQENIKEKGKILVATQVIEASLDIDADILFTELAPMDSIIQRMGRILRRIKNSYQVTQQITQPNVFIFYQNDTKGNNGNQKVKLCSGAGNVYNKELLYLTLAVFFKYLCPQKDKDITSLIQNYKEGNIKNIKEFAINLFNIISDVNKFDVDKSKKKKNKVVESARSLFTQEFNESKFIISEKQKKELVDEVYDNLPTEPDFFSKYLEEFYETLSVLDAGYMSEKKKDAQKIFREIHTVPVIMEQKKQDLKYKIKHFLEDYQQKQIIPIFRKFKEKILNDFVINVDYRKTIKEDLLELYDWSYLIAEIDNIDQKLYNKLKRWLKGIYVCKGNYNPDEGAKDEEANILKQQDENFEII